MELAAVGRVENLDELDVEPIIIPVIGYTAEKEEVVFRIQFRCQPIAGMFEDAMPYATLNEESGKMELPAQLAVPLMEAHILNNDEWKAWLRDPKVIVHTDTIKAVFVKLAEVYTGRDFTEQRPSHNGRVTPKKTTRVAAKSTARTSARSR